MPNLNQALGGHLTEEKPKCLICHDIHVVHPRINGNPDYSEVIPCPCQAGYLAEQRIRYSNLPTNTEHMTFANFHTEEHISLGEAEKYAQSLATGEPTVKWLTLIGNPDRGKTHLAIAICREWLSRGQAAHYAFVPILLKELRDGFEQKNELSYSKKFEYLCNVPLLVLDDLGVEKRSDWAEEQIQTIVHYRGINGLRLVVTSNKPIDKMPIDPEHRIASRLQRESWCRVVSLKSAEHRLFGWGKK